MGELYDYVLMSVWVLEGGDYEIILRLKVDTERSSLNGCANVKKIL